MSDSHTFSIFHTEYVRDIVSSNSLGNFIYWNGPAKKTKHELDNLDMNALLSWWEAGKLNFDKAQIQPKLDTGDFIIFFENWINFSKTDSHVNNEIFYDTITFFPIGEKHIDCSKTSKMRLKIIEKDSNYCLNRAFQCAGVNVEELWKEILCCFDKYA
tara:strand:- start:743 stop:1216 length:474 start_codon:yes stop_codon:yes gene_type:complete